MAVLLKLTSVSHRSSPTITEFLNAFLEAVGGDELGF
jgi:hypothetical protein